MQKGIAVVLAVFLVTSVCGVSSALDRNIDESDTTWNYFPMKMGEYRQAGRSKGSKNVYYADYSSSAGRKFKMVFVKMQPMRPYTKGTAREYYNKYGPKYPSFEIVEINGYPVSVYLVRFKGSESRTAQLLIDKYKVNLRGLKMSDYRDYVKTAFSHVLSQMGVKSGPALNLMGRLIKTQREQKKFLKQLFMSGATLEEYTIHLYPENGKLYKMLEGGASWNHKKREIRLFAGEEEEELKFMMAHELAHLITFDLAKRLGYTDNKGYPSKVPIWYMEGIAEFGAIQWSEKADPGYYLTNRALRNFKTDVKNGNTPTRTLNAVINRNERKVKGHEYAAVATFVEYLYKKHGGSKTVVSIWVDAAEDGNIKTSIERHTGRSFNTLKAEWESYLKNWYDFQFP